MADSAASPAKQSPAPMKPVAEDPAQPRISVVTPNYNYGHYLDETICSVLAQGYPNLEYIVIDGGSTDNSVDVIRRHEAQLACWESKKDNGQADAINRGFAKSTGDILGWLNSDDLYLPGTLKKVQKVFSGLQEDEAAIVFGNCVHVNEESKYAYGSDVEKMHGMLDLTLCDYVIQPACFWNRKVMDTVGALNEDLNFGFDWDWFIRAVEAGVRFVPIGDFLALYRMHAEHKSGAGGSPRLKELAAIYARYHSRQLADDFLRYKTANAVRKAYYVIDRSRIGKLFDQHRIVHRLFFPRLTWKEFENIRRM